MIDEHEGEPELTAAELRLLEAVPDGDDGDDALDDGVLAAFRRGELDDAATAAMAGRLARDPQARALLVAQAEAARGSDAMSVARVMARQHTSRRGAVVAGALVIAALAAALALFVGRPTLPEFTLDGPFGGLAETRGEDQGPTRVFVPGNTLTMYARPAAPVSEPLLCVAVIDDGAYLMQPLDPKYVTVAANGVCRLEGPVEAILPHFSRYTVSLILLPRGSPDRTETHGIPRREDGKWLVEKIEYRSVEQP